MYLVRALRVEQDTLRGVVTRAHYCSNCMVAFGLDQVDSVRTAIRVGDAAGTFLGGLGIGALLIWAYLLSIGFGLT